MRKSFMMRSCIGCGALYGISVELDMCELMRNPRLNGHGLRLLGVEVSTTISFEITRERPLSVQVVPLDYVIPAWSAGIQIDMDVSAGVLANLGAGENFRVQQELKPV